jgi:MerC mercury resistance protein
MVHCLLTPVVISLFPDIIPYLPGDASFHRLLAVGIVLFGFVGFVPGYMVHRRKPLLALIGIGMCLILAVAWSGEDLNRTLELVLSVGGSLLLVAAHLLNRSFCRECRICKDDPGNCHTTQVASLESDLS